jgi:hypothetical protein
MRFSTSTPSLLRGFGGRGALALIAAGSLSVFFLTGCFQTDSGDSSSKSAHVKGTPDDETGIPKDNNDTVNPAEGDTLPLVCGTPDPGTDPVDPLVDPIEDTSEVLTPVDNDGFEPIDWTAKALPGSEGWDCMAQSPAVCAENGKTYRNVCEAAWSGQKAKSAGRCP